MRTLRIIIALGFTCGASPILGNAAIIYVDPNATGSGDGTSWFDAYTDLQPALQSAPPGTEIWVARGTYYPSPPGEWEGTFALASGVALYGGFAGGETDLAQRDPLANETVLSGDIDQNDVDWYPSPGWNGNEGNAFHVVTALGVDETAVLDGFSIVRGSTNYPGHSVPEGDLGSGLFCIDGNPRVAQCVFRWNTAAFGAGAYVRGGAPEFASCTFEDNLVRTYKGAGVCATGGAAVTIEDCAFLRNVAADGVGRAGGAGLFIDFNVAAAVTDSRFAENLAENLNPSGDHEGAYGGAIYSLADSVLIADCVLRDNAANAGSAIYTWGDALTVVNSLFVDNVATAFPGPFGDHGGQGGAIALAFSPVTASVSGSVFVGNVAGEGGGIHSEGTTSLRNCILWENEATAGGTHPIDGQFVGAFDIAYSCIEYLLDPIPGEDPPDPADFPGCHQLDPLFLDLALRDLHLNAGSPCVDAGDNVAVPAWVTHDLDGRPRFFDDPDTPDTGHGTPPIVDMGPYERGGGSSSVPAVLGRDLARLRISPNPANGAVRIELTSARDRATESVVAEVVDIRGRIVARFPLGNGPDGAIDWNVRSTTGELLPSGVYLVRVRGLDGEAGQKIQVLR